jgi:hypothetical protein
LTAVDVYGTSERVAAAGAAAARDVDRAVLRAGLSSNTSYEVCSTAVVT